MTGLEKMIRQIEEEAENTAASIIREAEEKAAALCREAEQSCARIRKEAEEEGQVRAEEILRKACSGAGMEDRKRELQLKQELLCETMERALRMLQELEDDRYFALLLHMVPRYIRKEEGELLLSPEDRKRVPEDFEEKLRELASSGGGSLKLSGESGGIEGGFLLRYGGIEENCSFAAIFQAEQERIKDELQRLLFQGTEPGRKLHEE